MAGCAHGTPTIWTLCSRVIRGKAALRAHWAEGPRRIPELRFEVVGTYLGVDSLVINYRNQKGGLVNEVLIFDGPLWLKDTAPTRALTPTQPVHLLADCLLARPGASIATVRPSGA
jgi:hypothetical protein